MWVNYYDILARGAFGNYFDLLREVTLSPLMGLSVALAFLFSVSDSLFWWLRYHDHHFINLCCWWLPGEYLSFFRNTAFDHDQNYPDESLGLQRLLRLREGPPRVSQGCSGSLNFGVWRCGFRFLLCSVQGTMRGK